MDRDRELCTKAGAGHVEKVSLRIVDLLQVGLFLLFIHPRAPNLISIPSCAKTRPF